MKTDTIAAISTPLGEGGISVVRISGENAVTIADTFFKTASNKRLTSLKGYSAAFGHVYSKEALLDEAVALVFWAPKSYTGENVVEISVHGGVYLTKQVLRSALSCGARLANPGEFTERAFLNGKLDLAEAESVMGLISAKGKQALNISLANKNGAVSKTIQKITDDLLSLSASISVFSDYPEDDTMGVEENEFISTLNKIKSQLTLLIKNYDTGRLITGGINTVIVGRPNVGKSTLMNLLAGSRRSIVTSTEGTTRDIIEDTVMVGDLTLCLADTAGIRAAEDEIEKIGVEMALERLETADLCLAVFDSSSPLKADDLSLLQKCANTRCIAVLNKSDLPPKIDQQEILALEIPVVQISALTGDGAAELAETIANLAGTTNLDPNAAILGSERQKSCAEDALTAVTDAASTLEQGFTLDAVGVLIDDALTALLSLLGKRVTNEVADRVFRDFCVGK